MVSDAMGRPGTARPPHDAGFPEPEFLQGVEAEGIRYVARLRTNERLKRRAEPHLTRPPGRPPSA